MRFRVMCCPILPLITLLLSGTAYGVTWNVPADAPTIQAGIDSASVGDIVFVECGTYYEHDIVMKSGLSFFSETGKPIV
jgi:hypothetical protein